MRLVAGRSDLDEGRAVAEAFRLVQNAAAEARHRAKWATALELEETLNALARKETEEAGEAASAGG